MSEVQARIQTTTYDLCRALEVFVSDNKSARSVEDRWLASLMETTLSVARNVRNGSVTDEQRAAVAVFRLTEIEAEKARRQSEIDELDREARRLSSRDEE